MEMQLQNLRQLLLWFVSIASSLSMGKKHRGFHQPLVIGGGVIVFWFAISSPKQSEELQIKACHSVFPTKFTDPSELHWMFSDVSAFPGRWEIDFGVFRTCHSLHFGKSLPKLEQPLRKKTKHTPRLFNACFGAGYLYSLSEPSASKRFKRSSRKTNQLGLLDKPEKEREDSQKHQTSSFGFEYCVWSYLLYIPWLIVWN